MIVHEICALAPAASQPTVSPAHPAAKLEEELCRPPPQAARGGHARGRGRPAAPRVEELRERAAVLLALAREHKGAADVLQLLELGRRDLVEAHGGHLQVEAAVQSRR